VALVRADVSEERVASIITVKRNNEIRTALAVTSKLLALDEGNINCVRFEVFKAVTMKNGVFWDVTPCGSCKNRRFGRKSPFLQEPHGITSQKPAFLKH
jgi:hypothetical protein